MSGSGNWADQAVCAQTDPEIFFPELGGSSARAKRICTTCPVREQCLDWAISLVPLPSEGIWGGMGYRALRKEAARRGRPVPCEACGAMFVLPDPAHPVVYCSARCRAGQRRAQQAAAERRRAATRARKEEAA